MHFVTDRWQLCSFILEDLWFLHMRVDNQTWWQPDQYLVAAGETSFNNKNGLMLAEITRDRIGQIRPPGRLKAACWASSSQHPRQNHHAQLWLFGGLGAHDYEHDDDKMPKAESKEFALQSRFFRRPEIGIMSDLWVYHAQRIEVADIPEESIEWTAAIALLVDKHESLITGNWERIGVFGDYPGRTPDVRTRASFGVSFGFSGAGLLLIMCRCRWEQDGSQGWAGCQAQCCCGRPRGQRMAACGCLVACRASGLSTRSRARATTLPFSSAISKR